MAGFCTVHESSEMDWATGEQSTCYRFKIYSYNMRMIWESRGYNQPQHAREAARRFIAMFTQIDMRSGIVRKRKKK